MLSPGVQVAGCRPLSVPMSPNHHLRLLGPIAVPGFSARGVKAYAQLSRATPGPSALSSPQRKGVQESQTHLEGPGRDPRSGNVMEAPQRPGFWHP